MIELIKKLKPKVVVTGIAHFESVTSSSFEHLLDVTKEIKCRLFLDISDHFDLSSLPTSKGVFKYLAANTLPSHAAIVCGLLKNQVIQVQNKHNYLCFYIVKVQIKYIVLLSGFILDQYLLIYDQYSGFQVYSDLEVGFVISEEAEMFKALCKTVELLQGNTSIISQYYYGCLFHELLSFQLVDRHPPLQVTHLFLSCS